MAPYSCIRKSTYALDLSYNPRLQSTYLISDALDSYITGPRLLLDLVIQKSSAYQHVVSSRNWEVIEKRFQSDT